MEPLSICNPAKNDVKKSQLSVRVLLRHVYLSYEAVQLFNG